MQNELLMYTKRRDRILILAVSIYLSGPTVIEWAESLNDVHLNLSKIDTRHFHKGEERILFDVKEEISLLREDIRKQGHRTFGWRDVFGASTAGR